MSASCGKERLRGELIADVWRVRISSAQHAHLTILVGNYAFVTAMS